jgi:hypothetical protein
MPPGFSKGDEEEEGVLHNFTGILLAMREKRERSDTARVCNLSELVETWSMRVSFLYRASSLFIASRYRRDNYKRGNGEHPMQSKQEQFPRESLRLYSGKACSDTFPKIQGLVLKED